MLDTLKEIARTTKKLEAELKAFLGDGRSSEALTDDATASLSQILATRYPDKVVSPCELRGLLKIGRAARQNEPLSPVVTRAALAIAQEYRSLIADLNNKAAHP